MDRNYCCAEDERIASSNSLMETDTIQEESDFDDGIIPQIDIGSTFVVDNMEIRVGIQLGAGVFGRVFHTIDEYGQNMAMKVQKLSNRHYYNKAMKEMQILNHIEDNGGSARNVVDFLRATVVNDEHCMFFELMGQSLEDELNQRGAMEIEVVRRISYQLLTTIEYIHSIGIVHTDIKPSNILCAGHGGATSAKLCDFENAVLHRNSSSPLKNVALLTIGLLHSFLFIPPEVYLGIQLNASLDMWSLGCTLAQLYTGQVLFPSDNDQQLNLFHVELRGIPSNTRIGRFYKGYFKEIDGKLACFSHEELEAREWSMEVDERAFHLSSLNAITLYGINGKKREIKPINHYFGELLCHLLELDNSKRATARELKNRIERY